eukprot:497208_1
MSTEFALKKLKTINKSTQYTVYGYVRECQLLLPTDKSFYNIPPLISYLILHYFSINEYFTKYGSYIQLNDAADTVTITDLLYENNAKNENTAYGNTLIECNKCYIYKWKIKIIEINQDNDIDNCIIGIGIDSSNKEWTEYCYLDKQSMGFIYWETGTIEKSKIGYHSSDYHTGFKQNDIVTMNINTKQKCIELAVNDKNKIQLQGADILITHRWNETVTNSIIKTQSRKVETTRNY